MTRNSPCWYPGYRRSDSHQKVPFFSSKQNTQTMIAGLDSVPGRCSLNVSLWAIVMWTTDDTVRDGGDDQPGSPNFIGDVGSSHGCDASRSFSLLVARRCAA